MRYARGTTILILLLACQPYAALVQAMASEPQIKPIIGQFLSEGHPVDEFHCEPKSPGKHPVVLLIHGCAPPGFGDDEFRQMCVSLAEHGYYAMFVEYFSRTGQPNCAQFAMLEDNDMRSAMPGPSEPWLHEIAAAGDSLASNTKADATRFGLIGFSSGWLLALVEASWYHGVVRAVVDYYGFSTPRSRMYVHQSQTFPPTLILQGQADSHASVARSIELDSILAERGAIHEIHIFPDVEHAFNFHGARGYDEAAAKAAWERTLSFLDQHLK